MKKLSKSFMAIFLVLAILMTAVPAFATTIPNTDETRDALEKVKEAAEKLHNMGIFPAQTQKSLNLTLIYL